MIRVSIVLSILFSAFLVSVAARQNKSESQDDENQDDLDELSAAAIQLNTSSYSPLIRTLYEATREIKEQSTLTKLTEALNLIQQGADLHAVDPHGRTALHWAVIVASPATKASIQKVCAKIVGQLIAEGVDVGRADVFNNTAFGYVLYSPNYEIQTLLLENGGVSDGLGAGTDIESAQQQGTVLSPGLTIWIRLTTPVWSDRSRIGDPIEAVVTVPALQDSQVVLAPGTKLNGTLMFAQKAASKYSQPRLVFDVANVVQANGTTAPISTRVLVVDNARETAENNEIRGIVQPHASKKEGIALLAIGIADPIAGLGILGTKTAFGASLRREIFYPAGTDLMVQIVRPSALKEMSSWSGWPTVPVDPELQRLVEAAPLRTAASNNEPSDLTNVLFIGSREELESAFAAAGWTTSDHLSLKSALNELQAAARQSGYDHAPLSLLTVNGAPPDLVYQKTLNTIAKRHHIRIWQQTGVFYEGRPTWIGAATHDIGVGHAGKKWFHRIDPWVDRERDKVGNDLMFVSAGVGYAQLDRPNAPTRTSNATGDQIITDGKVLAISLRQ